MIKSLILRLALLLVFVYAVFTIVFVMAKQVMKYAG